MRGAIPAFVWWAAAQPLHAQRTPTLEAVAQAMGGKDRVLAVRTLIVEGTGELLYFGQTQTPYAKTIITMMSFRRSLDFANRRWRLDQVRELRYLTPMPTPLRASFGLDGDVGYNVIGDASMDRVSASLAANIERLRLKVETVLGLHNRPMAWPPR